MQRLIGLRIVQHCWMLWIGCELRRLVQSPIPSHHTPNQASRRDLCLGRTRVLSLPASILRSTDRLLLYVLTVLAAARLRARLGRSFRFLQAQILQKTLYVIYANMDFFTGETRIRVRFLLFPLVSSSSSKSFIRTRLACSRTGPPPSANSSIGS